MKASKNRESSGNVSILLSPSLSADVSVTLPASSAVDPALDAEAALCAGAFILRRRGLPLEEVIVEINGRIYTVISEENGNKIGVLTAKCKELFTKKPIFIENTELLISDCLLGKIRIRLLESSDIDLISENILRMLLYREETGGADVAAAFSRDKCKVKMKLAENSKSTSAPDTAAAIAVASVCLNPAKASYVEIFTDKGRMKFSLKDGRLFCLLPEIPNE